MDISLKELRNERNKTFIAYEHAKRCTPMTKDLEPLCLYDVKVEKARLAHHWAKFAYENAIEKQARKELDKEAKHV